LEGLFLLVVVIKTTDHDRGQKVTWQAKNSTPCQNMLDS